MTRHTWTSADLAKWRKLARLADRAIAEAAKGQLASGAAMGDLGRAARSAYKASFPTRDRDQWRILSALLRGAEDFATVPPSQRAANIELMRIRVREARHIIGDDRPAPMVAAPSAPAETSPWYLRD